MWGRRLDGAARSVLWWAIAAVAVIGVAGAGAQTASSSADRDAQRRRLVEFLAAGNADSARILVRSDRLGTLRATEHLLVDQLGDLVRGDSDSAAAKAASAARIAELYAVEFGDSAGILETQWYLALSPSLRPRIVNGWERFREARRLHEASRWKEALPLFVEAANVGRETGDPYLEQASEALRGYCLHAFGNYADARSSYQRAFELCQRNHDPLRGARNLVNIARTLQAQDRHDEARARYLSVLPIARSAGDWELLVAALGGLGKQYEERGNLDSARVLLEEALTLARDHQNGRMEAGILVNLARVVELGGDLEGAVSLQEQALRRIHESGASKADELAALQNLAHGHSLLGHYSQALALYRDALSLAADVGSDDATVFASNRIGQLYLFLGRPDEAIPYHRDALARVRRLDVPDEEVETDMHLARAYEALGHRDEARAVLEEALETLAHSASRSPAVRVLVLEDLGRVLTSAGNPSEARTYLSEALSIAQPLENPLLSGRVEVALASAQAACGDSVEALALLARATERGRAIRSQTLLEEALVVTARLVRARGDLLRADSLLAEALHSIEEMRRFQRGAELRMEYLTTKTTVFAELVSVLYEIGLGTADSAAHREAFRISESARARALLDLLGTEGTVRARVVEPALADRERRAGAELATLQAEISKAVAADHWDARVVDSLEIQLAEASRAYDAVEEEIGARHGSTAQGGRIPSVEDVRDRVLGQQQFLIEYLVADTETFAFLLGPDRFRMVRIPAGRPVLEERVRALREALGPAANGKGTDDAACRNMEHELYALLLEPMNPDLSEGARLLIVPDGPLFYLPFSALHDGTHYVCERHAVSFSPSAGALDPNVRPAHRGAARSLLAVGNPATYRGGELLAMLRESAGWRFGMLPFAEEEAHHVARHYHKARVLTGAAATEESVKDALERVGHVHLATHGLLNEEEPSMSGLLLAQDEDPAEDGFLQAHEIAKLHLNANLVVLSACNSGLGRIAGGEGVMGLSRAFLEAGARTLVITLWAAADRPTMQMMDRFYEGALDEGLPLDIALQRAQESALAAGAAPREWAPFVITGSVAALPAASRLGMMITGVFLVGIFIVAGVLLRRRRMTTSHRLG